MTGWAKAVGDHLALLDDLDAPVDGAPRLGEDRPVRRSPTAADGTSVTSESGTTV
jgi:hypothetical protein